VTSFVNLMKTVRKILKLLLVLLVSLILWNYKLVLYGIGQLKGQMHLVYNAKPIEEVLKDQNLNPDYKRKLLLVQQIKKFAVDSLGLKNSENYTTFYDQHGKPVLWVLTGCEPFALKAFQWQFPFLGDVSYKGFFVKEKGDKEFNDLIKKGFDADLSTTSGWSTLGWFKDPVLSNFLKHSEGRLAETIIHELTHGTVYLKSSVDYNENLATFVGEQGAEKFLTTAFGKNSKELNDYLHYKSDEQLYGNLLLQASQRMDSLYHSFNSKSFSWKEKLFMKDKLIAEILLHINKQPFYRKEYYYFDFRKERLPNNTFFMANLRYREKQDDFEKLFHEKYRDDLHFFIEGIKKLK
jgi:predicted aminopeptidase